MEVTGECVPREGEGAEGYREMLMGESDFVFFGIGLRLLAVLFGFLLKCVDKWRGYDGLQQPNIVR